MCQPSHLLLLLGGILGGRLVRVNNQASHLFRHYSGSLIVHLQVHQHLLDPNGASDIIPDKSGIATALMCPLGSLTSATCAALEEWT